jgi:hypothetical protein
VTAGGEAGPHAALFLPRVAAARRRVRGEIEADGHAALPHGGHVVERRQSPGAVAESRDLGRKRLQHPLVVEDGERFEAHRGGERMTAVGVAVEERAAFGMAAEERVPHAFGRERGGHRQVPGREALGQAEKVGGHVLLFAREHRARATEARGHLVEDEKHVVVSAQVVDTAEEPARMDVDPRGHLHQRLHDDRGDGPCVGDECLLHRGERLGERRRRGARPRTGPPGRRHAHGVEGERREHRREAIDAPHADGAEGVAVVGLADRHEPRAPRLRRPLLEPELERHLEGRLDGARAVAREEHLLESRRCDLDEPSGEGDGRGIGEPEVRGVGHLGELGGDRRVEPRVAVPVDVAPHARGAVEVTAAVGVDEPRALAALDEQRFVLLHLGERVPDVVAVPLPEGRRGNPCGVGRRRTGRQWLEARGRDRHPGDCIVAGLTGAESDRGLPDA